ncbi:MAG TPA: arylsulfotransferase family protein [Polyangia bacterium]|jgi:hypothetical protein
MHSSRFAFASAWPGAIALCLLSSLVACGGGGSSNTTGTAGSGGWGGSGPGTGGTNASPANFTVNVTLSQSVATVAIVTWSVDVSIDSASISFGRDASNFEFQAPVDLGQPSYRTLLLGMKQNTTYSFRINASGGGKQYASDVHTVKTGYLPNGLPVFTVKDMNAAALYAGGAFTVNCIGLAGSPGIPGSMVKTVAFIIDKDGALVWALDISGTSATNCSRARMSYDGQHMLAANFANAASNGVVYRIGMDGTSAEQTWMLPGRSHDFAVLPNGHVVYFATDNMMSNTTPGGETIWDLDPSTGSSTKIYQETTNFSSLITSGQGESHTNHVAFSPDLGAVTFSMLFSNTIAAVSYPGGQLLGTFGGTQTDYSSMKWTWQHGHDVHGDHIWIFNNNMSGNSHVLGFTYSSASKTATQTLDYNPGIASTTFGDVKELPNGNLFVTFSDNGAFHEITATGTLLRTITTTTAVGYSEHRASLYGPPPPFDK